MHSGEQVSRHLQTASFGRFRMLRRTGASATSKPKTRHFRDFPTKVRTARWPLRKHCSTA